MGKKKHIMKSQITNGMDGMAIMKIKSILKVQNENFDILREK